MHVHVQATISPAAQLLLDECDRCRNEDDLLNWNKALAALRQYRLDQDRLYQQRLAAVLEHDRLHPAPFSQVRCETGAIIVKEVLVVPDASSVS